MTMGQELSEMTIFSVFPRSYSIFIKPNLDKNSFDGSVVIHLDIIRDTNVIKLDAKNIKVKKVNLRVSGSVIKSPIITTNEEDEEIIFEFGSLLRFGWAVLTIHYTGLINGHSLLGLHRVKSNDAGEDGLITNFQPTSSRQLFPCWDDPTFRCTFELSVCGPRKVVLSNMPAESTDLLGNEYVVKFLPTPNMSPDQVAIAIGNYCYMELVIDNKKLRLYVSTYKTELARISLEYAGKIMQTLTEILGLSYPLPKLDILAVESISIDYLTGWGLIMIPTRYLFLKTQPTLHSKKATLEVLSRALAPQWLGNLVSMESWDHYWVMKGFAIYIATKACNELYPDIQPWFWFSVEEKEEAFSFQEFKIPGSSTSLTKHVEIDSGMCSKGASLFVMLESYIGSQNFHDGVKNFLEKSQFTNTVPEIMWASFENYCKSKLADMMTSWTYQSSYPLITVKSITQEGVDKVIELTQERFYPIQNDKENPDLWWIPITVVRSKRPGKIYHQVVMTEQKLKLRLPNAGKQGWIKLNSRGVGFYRVLYPKNLLQAFIPDFLSKTLPVEDRIAMLSDLRALVLSGREKTSTLLSFIAQLGDEDAAIWWIIIRFFNDLFIIIPHTKADMGFRDYGLTIFKKVYNMLGWHMKQDESNLETMLRPVILKLYCRFEDSDALIEAKKRFLGYLMQKEQIASDIRECVFYGSARIGGEKEYNQLIELFKKEDLESERDKLIEGICGFQSIDIMKKLIEFLMSDSIISQNYLRYMKMLLNNEFGTKLVWESLKKNWELLEDKFSANVGLLSDIVENAIFRWPSVDSESEVVIFGQANLADKVPLAFEKGLGKLRLYREWLNRDITNIEKFFSPWASSVSISTK